MPKMNMYTITFRRSTGYNYETDSFHNLMDRVWDAFDKKRDELVRKYNGMSIIDAFVFNSRSDHDGGEGYFQYTLQVPEADVNDIVRQFAALDSQSNVTHDKSEAVEYKKVKPLTEAQIVFRRYKGRLYFNIPSVKCYEQHFVNGKATEMVLCNSNAPITKGTFFKIFDGVFGEYDDCPFETAVYNKKFVAKPRKDAKLSWTYRTSLDYNMREANLKELLSYSRRGSGAKFIDFYLGNWREGEKLYLSDEVKCGIIKEQLAETQKRKSK